VAAKQTAPVKAPAAKALRQGRRAVRAAARKKGTSAAHPNAGCPNLGKLSASSRPATTASAW